MRIRALRRDATALGARDEPPLHQERLVNFLDSVALLAHRGREAFDADRTAVELFDDSGEYRAIHFVEAHRVDFEQLQRAERDLARDDGFLIHLREVTHPAKQSIRDARR